VKFYAVEGPDKDTDFWPAETTWENRDSDTESKIRICSPQTAFQAYRGFPGDLEQMIREHKAGQRQLLAAGKKGTTLDVMQAVHADVRDLKQSLSPLPDAVALLGKGVEGVRVNMEAVQRTNTTSGRRTRNSSAFRPRDT